MDFPLQQPTPTFISSYSRYFGARAWQLQGMGAPASTASLALTVHYIPFRLPFPYPAKRLFWANGTSAGSNWAAGLYSYDGAAIYTSGSIAGSGNSQLQFHTVSSDVLLTPNRYYFALCCDAAAANRFFGGSTTVPAASVRVNGLLQQVLGSLALPAQATFAQATTIVRLPLVGISRSLTLV